MSSRDNTPLLLETPPVDYVEQPLLPAPRKAPVHHRVRDWLRSGENRAFLRDVIGFFILGLFNNFGYVVFLSSAEALVPGASGVVLLANILPTLTTKLVAPWFMHRVPYSLRVLVLVTMACSSFQVVCWGHYLPVQLLGVVLASAASGGGEITYLALSSYYHKDTIVGWSSGTGGAGVLGSALYLVLRLFVSNKTAMLVCSPMPLLMLLAYFVVLTPRVSGWSFSNQKAVLPTTAPPGGDTNADGRPTTIAAAASPAAGLTARQRIAAVRPLLPYMVPLFFVYFFEYTINQGVAPAIVPKTWPHLASDRTYMCYQFLYQIGVFVSRSSVKLFRIKRLFFPAVLQAVNFLFLFYVALYGFIPWIWIIFALIFWEGLLGGGTYVNSMYLIAQNIAPETREFSLGIVSVADDLGITTSALVSIPLEHWLKEMNGLPTSPIFK